MAYSIKEIFYTLQGEGRNAGRAAVFCRFAGCNLWSGREADRAAATCTFCDTDFVGLDGPGGGRFADADALAGTIGDTWGGSGAERRFVVLTGGEPLLQVDAPLLEALKLRGFEIAVETNGTIAPPPGVDWLCVSPKALPLAVTGGDELKLVYPNPRLEPGDVEHLRFDHLQLQPLDGPAREVNTAAAVAYCLANPRWRLSVQTHKQLGIP
ncbi:MAG TPA: 7-carboxy-7-deazaguanine synthase [Allosphingosinicella sp.]|jgi:7-carboxy-7-deazaguanine synthase (Cx14CxxC type)